jgi:cell division protein FtsX
MKQTDQIEKKKSTLRHLEYITEQYREVFFFVFYLLLLAVILVDLIIGRDLQQKVG